MHVKARGGYTYDNTSKTESSYPTIHNQRNRSRPTQAHPPRYLPPAQCSHGFAKYPPRKSGPPDRHPPAGSDRWKNTFLRTTSTYTSLAKAIQTMPSLLLSINPCSICPDSSPPIFLTI